MFLIVPQGYFMTEQEARAVADQFSNVLNLLVIVGILTKSEARWISEAGPYHPDPWTAPHIQCHPGWLTVTLAIGDVSAINTFDCSVIEDDSGLAVDVEIPRFRRQLEA